MKLKVYGTPATNVGGGSHLMPKRPVEGSAPTFQLPGLAARILAFVRSAHSSMIMWLSSGAEPSQVSA